MEHLEINWELPTLPQILPVLQHAQTWFVGQLTAFSDHPAKCRQIQHLALNIDPSDILPDAILEQADSQPEFKRSLRQQLLYGPQQALWVLLPLATDVTTLVLDFFEFDKDALASICSLVRLETLTLQSCDFDDESSRTLVSTNHGYSLNVVNLHLTFRRDYQAGYSLWHALCICPHIRNLSLLSHTPNDPWPCVNFLQFPPRSVRDAFRCNVMSLECLSVGGLAEAGFQRFGVWIQKSRRGLPPGVSPALTNLKFGFYNAWTARSLISILACLRSTRLVALSLEGIDYSLTGRNVFKAVAELYPNLRGLTLIARQNARQMVTKPVTWRFPCWRYARFLALLPNIEHFEWNNLIPEDEPTLAPLQDMELHEMKPNLYPDGSPWWCWEASSFDDFYLNAAPFAACCPSLKTWVVNSGGYSFNHPVCEIRDGDHSNGTSGRIGCVRRRGTMHEIAKWDPRDIYAIETNWQAWPDIKV
jgi:hypothetical protein